MTVGQHVEGGLEGWDEGVCVFFFSVVVLSNIFVSFSPEPWGFKFQVDGPAHILANGWYGSKASAQQTCYSYRFQWARGANEWGGVTTKKPCGDDDFKVGP